MLFGIYGAGGFGREVAPLVAMMPVLNYEPRLITDETYAAFIEEGGEMIVVAIGNSRDRERITRKCERDLAISQVISPFALILDRVRLGDGAIVCSFAHLTSDIEIGEGFHANIYSYVGHDCRVGDFVTLAPKACVNGNVAIGDHAYIGTGAIIRQNLSIGAGAIIGMGAVVTKDVPPGETWAGNPARPLSDAAGQSKSNSRPHR